MSESQCLKVCSLFSGIGGFEVGLAASGHQVVMMCESDEAARAVLRSHFPNVLIHEDVRTITTLPECDILTAGWPCQDLSQAGSTKGLEGDQSRLVNEVFRLLSKKRKPEYVILENVPFALQLQKGKAIHHVTYSLEMLGYRWCYRILNTQMFGLPQRRRRLYILAARSSNPADLLFDGIQTAIQPITPKPGMVGFYWTEGNRGLGWSPDAIPPLKGGSGVGIPSPPAVWIQKTGAFVTPTITDAERLQGFPAGWTVPANNVPRGERRRWILIGNAVSVPVAKWLGSRLARPYEAPQDFERIDLHQLSKMPLAALGGPKRKAWAVVPQREGTSEINIGSLKQFGLKKPAPLSLRALSGFTERFERAPLAKRPEFLDALKDASRS